MHSIHIVAGVARFYALPMFELFRFILCPRVPCANFLAQPVQQTT
jgi:hypothetical protein